MDTWGFEVKAVYNPMMNGLDLYFIQRGNGVTQLLQAPELWNVVTIDPAIGSANPRPTMFIALDTVQSLVDALDKQGFRPDDNNRALGELDATKRHLEDLRTIIFKYFQGEATWEAD